jgi:hypothetical protein
MITSAQALARFGDPRKNERLHMTLWDVPSVLEIGVIPKRLYCNTQMVIPLGKAFRNLVDRGLADNLKTWDGCFNIRPMKGTRSTPSLHSWGIAIDVDAAWNGFRKPVTMDPAIAKCFKDAGFDWGGDWNPKDGMHFQLARI